MQLIDLFVEEIDFLLVLRSKDTVILGGALSLIFESVFQVLNGLAGFGEVSLQVRRLFRKGIVSSLKKIFLFSSDLEFSFGGLKLFRHIGQLALKGIALLLGKLKVLL